MAITATLTRDHVLAAIARLKASGVPANAESTKYDLIDPEGGPWPPKVVMEVAAEIATGAPFPRSEFSGGEETNSRLADLGFEIRLKAGLKGSDLTFNDLRSGKTVANDDLVQMFGIGNAGGMRWSSRNSSLVLIADHTKSLYDDRWDGDVLRYTGMGRVGDQVMTGQNLRLKRQPETGIAVHLFEVFEPYKYVYAGPVALVSAVESERQPDEEGNPRLVYIFPLKLVAGQPPTPTTEQIVRIRRERQRQLKRKSLEKLKQLADAAGAQTPGYRNVAAGQYDRNEAVAEYVKRAAKGQCGLCEQPAPFETSDGPYLESHHVIHLTRGGADKISNAVALCPNCHRRMHVLDRPED